MKVEALYPLLFAGVLALSACGGNSGPDGEPPATGGVPQSERPAEAPAATSAAQAMRVLFLGDSITAAYGLDPSDSFTEHLQRRVDSLGWSVRMVNAGLSGETSAGGLRRISWVLRERADVLVLELGGNDGLRGIALDNTRANLQAIIDTTRTRFPEVDVVIAGMMIPPNLGADYTREFQSLYPDLAEANDAALIPFILEGVGGVDSLMQSDGIHPTAAGNRVMAETVWDVLGPILEARLDEAAD